MRNRVVSLETNDNELVDVQAPLLTIHLEMEILFSPRAEKSQWHSTTEGHLCLNHNANKNP